MRWFCHQRSPSSVGGTQWYRLLLRAAYGLAMAHTLLCIVIGDGSAVFRFLSLVTWSFDLDLRTRGDVCTVYLTAKFDRPTFSRSEVIVRTNKDTKKQTDTAENIHLALLPYAGG